MTIVEEPEYGKRKKEHRCVVRLCQGGTSKSYRFCYKHARQYQKINNPLRYWFDVLRQNARRRKKPFELTIEEFRDFCETSQYLIFKGKNAGGYTIDRIRHWEGYKKGNLQILTLSQNSRKHFIDMKLELGRLPSQEEIDEFYKGQKFFNENIIPQYDGRICETGGEADVPF